VVPDHGLYSANANLLVVDLGRLSVTGKTNDPKALRKASGTVELCQLDVVIRIEE